MLEPCEGKLSRTVLRGEGGCKVSDLTDFSEILMVLSDRLFVSNLDKINCRESKKKKAGTYDLHKLKFRIA